MKTLLNMLGKGLIVCAVSLAIAYAFYRAY
jgi:hypothetical protein